LASLTEKADRCVKCGLCLPHCPTYALTANESESPRGRLALILAVENQQITMQEVAHHLSSCLLCNACENACPSAVAFEDIMNEARSHPEYPKPAIFFTQLSDPTFHQKLAPWLRFYQTSGLQILARASGLLPTSKWGRLEATLPKLPAAIALQSHYPALQPNGKSVALFIGCTGVPYDQASILATIRVLNYIGIEVHIPKQQGCCGALDAHAGLKESAAALLAKNQQAFSEVTINAVISLNTGCTAFLQTQEQAATPVMDILHFLLQQDSFHQINFQPRYQHIALHIPCSLTNQLKQSANPEKCLRKIPGLTLSTLASNQTCCGAAGTYLIQYPETANQLLQPRLKEIQSLQPDIIASPNLGCSLHLLQGLNRLKLTIPIQHPIQLLADALPA